MLTRLMLCYLLEYFTTTVCKILQKCLEETQWFLIKEAEKAQTTKPQWALLAFSRNWPANQNSAKPYLKSLRSLRPSYGTFVLLLLLYLLKPARSNSQLLDCKICGHGNNFGCPCTSNCHRCSGVSCGSKTRQRTPKVVYFGGMSSYQGLKSHNNIVSLGLPLSTEQCFANFVSSLKAHGEGRTGGGALSSTCNEAAEIFKIAAILNGLVLIGVAVGFVLLRIEAWLEESEQ